MASVSEARKALGEIRALADQAERMIDDVSGKVAYVNGNRDLPVVLKDDQNAELLAKVNAKIVEAMAAFPKLAPVDKLEAAPVADPVETPVAEL